MAVMNAEVRKAIDTAKAAAFGTVDAEGQPNVCVVGIKMAYDDETVYLSDQFFNKTLANLGVNDKVSVAVWGENFAYQIHGTATYVNEGAEYEKQKAWAEGVFHALGLPITPKGGVFVHVDAVYQMSAGPNAGKLLA